MTQALIFLFGHLVTAVIYLSLSPELGNASHLVTAAIYLSLHLKAQ